MSITAPATVVPAIRPAIAVDRPAVTKALTAAFYNDPVVRWIIPDAGRRGPVLEAFFALMAEAYEPLGAARVAPNGAGAALWAPPGSSAVHEGNADEIGGRIAELAGPDIDRFLELDELMEEHHPKADVYYLHLLGVLPEYQGQGIGSALMAPILHKCDRDGVPAYLEATSWDNRRLYERHGFEAIGEFAPAGGPPLYPMWRNPR